MHYFDIPRLGAYMAVPIVYNSCQSEAAFNEGLEAKIAHNKAVADLKAERDTKVEEFEAKLKELQVI